MKACEWVRRKIRRERTGERGCVRDISVTFCLGKSHLTKKWGGMEWWGGRREETTNERGEVERGRAPQSGMGGVWPQLFDWQLFQWWHPAFLKGGWTDWRGTVGTHTLSHTQCWWWNVEPKPEGTCLYSNRPLSCWKPLYQRFFFSTVLFNLTVPARITPHWTR